MISPHTFPSRLDSRATFSSSPILSSSLGTAAVATDSGSIAHGGGSTSELASSEESEDSKSLFRTDHEPEDHDMKFRIVPTNERLQPSLDSEDNKFLWRRAEQMALMKELMRVRIGKKGPTPMLLKTIGDMLEQHELVRVDVPPAALSQSSSAADGRDFARFLLEATLDCVPSRASLKTRYTSSECKRCASCQGQPGA
eukprot:gene21689-28713_t